jgi:CheY-like chemotaxis protein
MAVDDAPDILEYFGELAEKFGVQCDCAAGGEEALALIDRNGCYDIYFVDWRMPGMDGLELTRRIKERCAEKSVIIMISAVEWSAIEEEAKGAGVDKFLAKPLFPSDIAECLSECIGTAGLPAAKESLKETGVYQGRRVLLAEDIEINREIVIALLEPTQLEIDCAENGAEALRMFREDPSRYDMIFMDMQMPEMDGCDAARSIRALDHPRARTIPIVALTANVFKEDVEKCISSGMNDHIGKPIDIAVLTNKLRIYLEPG